jgi:hypothetical protein
MEKIEETAEYKLFEYIFGDTTYYRKITIPYDNEQDIFYSDIECTQIVARKVLSI